MSDMGLFRTTIEVQNWEKRGPIVSVPRDSGSPMAAELTGISGTR